MPELHHGVYFQPGMKNKKVRVQKELYACSPLIGMVQLRVLICAEVFLKSMLSLSEPRACNDAAFSRRRWSQSGQSVFAFPNPRESLIFQRIEKGKSHKNL